LRTARWIPPFRVQSPCLLVDRLVLHLPLPTDALSTAAVPLIPVMLVARLCAAPLPRCVTSSPGPKFTGESKVRWSPVIPTWRSCSARQVSTLSLSAPWSPNSLDLHPWSPNSLDLHHWSPNSLALHPRSPNSLVLHPLLAICCCLYLWRVIQHLTFPPYLGKHFKLVPTLRRFLAYPSLRVLVMLPPIPAALPRCSLDALNSIEFLQRWSSSS